MNNRRSRNVAVMIVIVIMIMVIMVMVMVTWIGKVMKSVSWLCFVTGESVCHRIQHFRLMRNTKIILV